MTNQDYRQNNSLNSVFAPLPSSLPAKVSVFTLRLAKMQPVTTAAVTLAAIVHGFVEGMGLALLLPLLTVVGVDVGSQSNGPAEIIQKIFNWIGLELTLVSVLGVFFVVAMMQTSSHFAQQYLSSRARYNLVHILREKVFQAASGTSWASFCNERSSFVTNAIITETMRIGNGFFSILAGFGLTATFIIYISFAAWVDWMFTSIIFGLGVVSFVFLKGTFGSSHRVSKDSTHATNNLQLVVSEHLGAGRMIRATNSERESYGRLEGASSRVSKTLLGVEVREHLTRATMEPLVVLCLVGIVYVSVEKIRLPAGELMVLLAIFYRLSPRMVHLQQILQRIIACVPIFTTVSELVQRFDVSADLWEGVPFDDLEKGIRLEKIALKLEGVEILKDLNLEIPALKTTALVGPSGSGKSMVLDIITGLRLPDEGAVKIDGTALSAIDLAGFRNAIGYAHQESGFFHDTVRNNILFFEPSLSDDEIWEVLELTNAAGFLKSKQGLDTVVGDQGIRLSGGQRQRLALARALARSPKILLLDEPTSALDSDAKSVILETLAKLHGTMTIILVTHDTDLAEVADIVYKFDIKHA